MPCASRARTSPCQCSTRPADVWIPCRSRHLQLVITSSGQITASRSPLARSSTRSLCMTHAHTAHTGLCQCHRVVLSPLPVARCAGYLTRVRWCSKVSFQPMTRTPHLGAFNSQPSASWPALLKIWASNGCLSWDLPPYGHFFVFRVFSARLRHVPSTAGFLCPAIHAGCAREESVDWAPCALDTPTRYPC